MDQNSSSVADYKDVFQGRPLLLTGDLNAEPHEPVLVDVLTRDQELGLRSAYAQQVMKFKFCQIKILIGSDI